MLALCFVSTVASAHTRSTSTSFWALDAHGGEVQARISQLELSRVGLLPEDPDYRERAADLLLRSLVLSDKNGPCPARSTLVPVMRAGQLLFSWRAECANRPTRLTSHFGQNLVSDHSHIISVNTGVGTPIIQVLTGEKNSLAVGGNAAASAAPEGGLTFVKLGVSHILSGWDHLIFLLALVVLAGSLREVAWLATGFTLGHSITLAVAVLGLARPAPLMVEALIAFSIVGLALENAWRLDTRSARLTAFVLPGLLVLGWLTGALPPLVAAGFTVFMLAYTGLLGVHNASFKLRLVLTAAFGLIHGFGFAGVLTGMDLAPGKIVQALLGFNLGVELGQVGVLALLWPALRALRIRGWPVAQAISVLAAGVGLWVYLIRIFV